MFPTLMLTAAMSASQTTPADSTQYLIEIRVLKGDPLGTTQDGTQKLVSEPRIVTLSGRPAFIRAGGKETVQRFNRDGQWVDKEVPVGVEVEFLSITRSDGKIAVELTTRHTVVEKGEGTEAVGRDARTVTPGRQYKKRVAAEAADNQVWIEYTISKPTR